MEPEELFDQFLEDTVYKDKQVGPLGVHITVDVVLRLTDCADIDFGGGEMKPAGTEPVATEKRSPDDDYAWWNLEQGTYLVRFNERLKDGAPPVLLVPDARLLRCGGDLSAALPSSHEIIAVLRVPEKGVCIKENARVAVLRPL